MKHQQKPKQLIKIQTTQKNWENKRRLRKLPCKTMKGTDWVSAMRVSVQRKMKAAVVSVREDIGVKGFLGFSQTCIGILQKASKDFVPRSFLGFTGFPGRRFMCWNSVETRERMKRKDSLIVSKQRANYLSNSWQILHTNVFMYCRSTFDGETFWINFSI